GLSAPVAGSVAAGACGAEEQLAAPRRAASAARPVAARVLCRGRALHAHESRTGGARRHLPAAPGVDLGGRDRPYPLAAGFLQAPIARVADRVAHGARHATRYPRVARSVASDVASFTGRADRARAGAVHLWRV